MTSPPIRLVQWTTGNVSREAVKGILERPGLELVGVFAYSADKVGRDLGELCGLDRTLGIAATNRIEDIVALQPDCVVYMPLHPEIEHLETLLRAGINVATTAHFMTGRAYGEEARARLEAAAVEGGASMFGSGINPGYMQHLASVATNVCRTASYVRILESFDIGPWAGDANQDELGWGRPAGDPNHAADIKHATIPFGDACEALAELLDVSVDGIRCDVEFTYAGKDLDIPGRDVRAGTVAGVYARWIGSAGGLDVVETAVKWTITADLVPAWDITMDYEIEIRGHPNVTLRAGVLPEFGSMTMDEMVGIGSVITAMPVVNAIPAVVAARPGIVGYSDLPAVGTRLIPASPPAQSAAVPPPSRPHFTRQSTLQELTASPVGRLLNRIVARQAKKTATTDRDVAMFVGMAAYQSIEQLVLMSDGKMSWPVADSIIDLANGQPHRIAGRAVAGVRKRWRATS
ncbi:dihydrodipicolinate reductase [Mycobacterium sp. 360MFTsu5.1]|uniref:NAD(P)H-dependent amine dehydrogenase family protein n=1 Tax=Mycobacterium sp. 360MFTsu5.1 TaxID=1172186 RepID=UPI000685CE7A|nr:dihydrodipicolinate reductase [Mycobacterium sp. 360MFTsu5.1]